MENGIIQHFWNYSVANGANILTIIDVYFINAEKS